MRIKLQSNFIVLENYHNKEDGDDELSWRFLAGGMPALLAVMGGVLWMSYNGLNSLQPTFSQWQLYWALWATILLSFGAMFLMIWLYKPTDAQNEL